MSDVKQAIQELVLWKLTEGESALLKAQSKLLPTQAQHMDYELPLQTIRSLREAMADRPMQDAAEAVSWLAVAAAELRERGGSVAAPSVEEAIRHIKAGNMELRIGE